MGSLYNLRFPPLLNLLLESRPLETYPKRTQDMEAYSFWTFYSQPCDHFNYYPLLRLPVFFVTLPYRTNVAPRLLDLPDASNNDIRGGCPSPYQDEKAGSDFVGQIIQPMPLSKLVMVDAPFSTNTKDPKRDHCSVKHL